MDYFNEKWAYYNRQRNAAPKPSYVMDGLQLWLDGIQNTRDGHDSKTRIWEDISGNGYDFIPMHGGKYPTVGDTYFTGFDADTFFISSNSDLAAMGPITTAGTLEAVYMMETAHTGQVFGFKNISGSSASLYKLCVKNQANLCVAGRYTTTTAARYAANGVGYHLGEIMRSSVTYGGSIAAIDTEVDGEDYDIIASDSGWGNNGGNCVGARWHTSSTNYYPFHGKIYCVRYYNRILSAEEREHNRLTDIRRFGA